FDEEDPPRQISVKQSKSGLIKLVYSPPLQDVDITLLDADPFYTFNEIVKDTVYLWHNALELDSLTFTLKSGELSDTIMSKPAKDSFIGSNFNFDKSFVQKFNFHKEDSLNIKFNHPIKNIKLDSISVYDTVSSFNISYSEFNNRILSIKLDSLQDNSSYSFQLLPGAITDIYNNSNTDTINIPIKTNDPAQFGNMILNFESSIDTQYLVTFLKKSEAIDTFIINGPRVVNLNKLEKGVYNLKLVEDLTRDNKWSSGSYREKRAPEKIKEITLDELKPGWDLNLTIDIKDIFYGTEIK
ncbi:MAG: hypothetical protein KJN84_12615, partial [Bacteroidia bacterium]|nr:hypothetical protein [Bacteroidia bacterium]